MDTIQTKIDDMIQEAGSLVRVKEWPLLAIVAQRWDIPSLTKQCRDLVSLFCEGGQTNMPEELRGDLSDREWGFVLGLDLMGE